MDDLRQDVALVLARVKDDGDSLREIKARLSSLESNFREKMSEKLSATSSELVDRMQSTLASSLAENTATITAAVEKKVNEVGFSLSDGHLIVTY